MVLLYTSKHCAITIEQAACKIVVTCTPGKKCMCMRAYTNNKTLMVQNRILIT